MSGWVQLERFNNWGSISFVYPGGHARAVLRNRRKDGTVMVKWPDGTESTERVVVKHFSDSVGDMGHVYPVEYSLPGIMFHAKGIDTWIPLDSVLVAAEDLEPA